MALFRRPRLDARFIAFAMIVVQVCVSVGVVPTPAMVTRWMGDAGWLAPATVTRHPCEDHLCGCTNAHECWAACCCFTTTQRLVWAIEKGVEPPHANRYRDEEIATAGAEVMGRHVVVSVSVLRERMAHGVATESGEGRAPKSKSPAMTALGCKALQQFLALAPPVSVMERGTIAGLSQLPRIAFVSERPERSNSRALDITAPPPRSPGRLPRA